MLRAALLVLGAFLAGSIPFGLILARLRGVDIRSVGSGNIGATNVARALGKRFALLVLLLDVGKGLGPVLAARWLLAGDPLGERAVAAAMLAAVLGHTFTPFLRFQGGKGVATGLGVFLAVSPLAGAIGLGLYVGLYAAFRISSLGSLAGTTAAVVALFATGAPRVQALAGVAIAAVIVGKHHDNIRRLLRREEKSV
jgi:glycerol-3-phosphate acyltransferase PlsY